MRYFYAYFSSVLGVLCILSCQTVSLALNSTQVTVMKNLSNHSSIWKTNASDPCQWDGVSCSENNADVVELHLSSLGFNGNVWPDVCKLQALRALILSNNSVSTPSDEEIRFCTSLVSLNLSSNAMTGSLPSLNPLQKLLTLDLSHNIMTGNLTAQIQNLRELKTFIVTYGNFDGSVAFGGLNLEKVDVSHNHFGGGFPQELILCTNLTYLDLSSNSFIGPIPDTISRLDKLETLVLSSNNFSGSIPTSLKALTKLSRFAINQNKLNGNIPDGLSAISGLESLDLSCNRLSGPIPLKVFSLSNLKALDLNTNLLSGEIPQNFSKSLFRLRVGNNNLIGNIPSSVSVALNLTYLEMNNNLLNGPLPEQLASCTKLQLLDLGHNAFEGSLTNVLPKLEVLQYLKLPHNRFEGSILDKLSNLSNLTYVDLSDNLLSGSLSPQFFELKQLQNLRLQNNNILGVIPSNIQDSKSLLELQLGRNNLNGTIPQGVGNLNMLQIALNLSQNFLEGEIPSSLSNLITLEILDLSNNRLNGNIPTSLSNMKSLRRLDLSYNNLTGTIPPPLLSYKYIVFTYTGNPGLLSNEQFTHFPTKKKKPSAGLLVGAAVSGAIFALGAVGFIMRRYKEDEDENEAIRKILKNLWHPRISHEELLAATNIFHVSNLIAPNSSQSVYKGILGDGTRVAVKVLNLMHEQSGKIFKAECRVLQKVRHRNLCRIITTCCTDQFKALVFEYYCNGSLEKHLYENRGHVCRLGVMEVLKIAIDVAHAVEYLHHDCFLQIVHCDIKPSNVLLDETMTAHLSDFGIARLMGRIAANSLTSTMGLRGSVGYMAPGMVFQISFFVGVSFFFFLFAMGKIIITIPLMAEYGLSGEMSVQGDVYSYGILLLEMVTRRRPTDSMFDGDVNLHRWVKGVFPDRAAEVVGEGLVEEGVGERNENCLISLLRVGLLCSGDSPKERPTMREVCNLLKEIQQPCTPFKLRPTISNLVSQRRPTFNCEETSDTQSSTF